MRILKYVILPLGLVSLIAGIWGGLSRLGLWSSNPSLIIDHGAIMVGGFLGTLIMFERTVGEKRYPAIIIPGINALSVFLFWGGLKPAAFYVLLCAALLFLAHTLYRLVQYQSESLILETIGQCAYLLGFGGLIMGKIYPAIVPLWMSFFVFTIAAERLELSKFLPSSPLKTSLFRGVMALSMLGALLPFHGIGKTIFAIGLIGSGLWFIQFDMALKSIKREGQHRFTGWALLGGFFWLAITGFILLAQGRHFGFYDAAVHAFFLGFVFHMIFAHAPIIIPGLLSVKFRPYHSILYLPLVVLFLSVALRVAINLQLIFYLHLKYSGLLSGISIVMFVLTIIALLVIGNRVYSNKSLNHV
jgi:hypothetical protein